MGAAFSEVDGLVLSLFSYIDFSSILKPGASGSVTVAEGYEKMVDSGCAVSAKTFNRPGYFDTLWSKMASSRFWPCTGAPFSSARTSQQTSCAACTAIGTCTGACAGRENALNNHRLHADASFMLGIEGREQVYDLLSVAIEYLQLIASSHCFAGKIYLSLVLTNMNDPERGSGRHA